MGRERYADAVLAAVPGRRQKHRTRRVLRQWLVPGLDALDLRAPYDRELLRADADSMRGIAIHDLLALDKDLSKAECRAL